MAEKVFRFILFLICLALTIYFIYFNNASLSAVWGAYTMYQVTKLADLFYEK